MGNGFHVEFNLRPVPPLLVVHRNNDPPALARPERPAARLEQTESLTPAASWSPTTNQGSVVGGQKTVAFIPQDGTGYFRLVLE